MKPNWTRHLKAIKDNSTDSWIYPVQHVSVPVYLEFKDLPPPFWLRTFLEWKPDEMNGCWRTLGGSVWTPDPSPRMVTGTYILPNRVEISSCMFMGRDFEVDIHEALKEGGLRYSEPRIEATAGRVEFSQVDSLVMATKLAILEQRSPSTTVSEAS